MNLQIIRRKTCVFSDAGKHVRANFFLIVERPVRKLGVAVAEFDVRATLRNN